MKSGEVQPSHKSPGGQSPVNSCSFPGKHLVGMTHGGGRVGRVCGDYRRGKRPLGQPDDPKAGRPLWVEVGRLPVRPL